METNPREREKTFFLVGTNTAIIAFVIWWILAYMQIKHCFDSFYSFFECVQINCHSEWPLNHFMHVLIATPPSYCQLTFLFHWMASMYLQLILKKRDTVWVYIHAYIHREFTVLDDITNCCCRMSFFVFVVHFKTICWRHINRCDDCDVFLHGSTQLKTCFTRLLWNFSLFHYYVKYCTYS